MGVLLQHGFTGTTQSMRPWAEALSAAGLTVLGPRLPGHGTTMKQMNTTRFDDYYATVEQAFDDLRGRCETVFAMGLSMGGTLCLRLAEQRAGQVAGLVLVNPAVATERFDVKLLPFLCRVLPTFKGVANDIKKEGVTELAYPKVPLKAANSLQQALPVVRGDLGRITCPVLLYRSSIDHVVEAISGRELLKGVPHAEERVLDDSYHVATLDNDAPTIFAGSLAFVCQHAPAAAG